MSFFRKPIMNKTPEAVVSLFWVYQYVRSYEAMPETRALRAIGDKDEQRRYKGQNFDYITPGGTFGYCNDVSLVEPSSLICIDLDHLDDDSPEMKLKVSPADMKQLLLADPYWGEETLLLFTSPRGHGVKWFVPIDLGRCDYKTWYVALRTYLLRTYGLGEKQVDSSVANLSHACFLSYDPDAYLRTNLIEHF